MICNLEILLGLANRNFKYGLKSTLSNPDNFPLSKVYPNYVDYFDGAELYGWNSKDINFFKKLIKPCTFTKFDLRIHSFDFIKAKIENQKNNFGDLFLKGIFVHNSPDKNTLENYKKLYDELKGKYSLELGFSIYTQKEIDILLSNQINLDVLQIPMNININLDVSELIKNDCKIYARSIFLQGAYFTDKIFNFTQKTQEKLKVQKKYFDNLSRLYNMDIGQYLFSEAITKASFNKFKGIIIGSSSFTRLKTYCENHKAIRIEEIFSDNRHAIVDQYLSDPRLWKK